MLRQSALSLLSAGLADSFIPAGLQLHYLGVYPEALKVVVAPHGLGKDMDDYVSIVQQGPSALFYALCAKGFLAFVPEAIFDVIGNGVNLPL